MNGYSVFKDHAIFWIASLLYCGGTLFLRDQWCQLEPKTSTIGATLQFGQHFIQRNSHLIQFCFQLGAVICFSEDEVIQRGVEKNG